ncbi:hypothetical protein V8E54_012941 [Elaphomyces granulatus]
MRFLDRSIQSPSYSSVPDSFCIHLMISTVIEKSIAISYRNVSAYRLPHCRLDVENDLQQELNLDTAQAAIPAARPVSHTGALPQADSGTTTTKRRGRPPGSRNKKTLQTEAAIAGAMQALQAGGTQGQRDEALQALQAALQGQDVQDNVGVTQGKKRGRPVGSKDNASRKKS